MRVCFLIFLCVFEVLTAYAQKTEILHQSGFKHDYVLTSLKYIEDPRDTTRLNYIATIQICSPQDYYLTVASWHVIEIKAKELGANSFIVSSFKEDHISVQLVLRLFFAGEKFLKLNALKRDTCNVHVFNQSHFRNDTGTFYLDKKKIDFDAKGTYVFSPARNKETFIATNSGFVTSQQIHFKKKKLSLFYVMPSKKGDFQGPNAHVPGNPEFSFRTGFLINGIPVSFSTNYPYELNYDIGRLVMAVYK